MDPGLFVLLTYLSGLMLTVGIRSLRRSKSYSCDCLVIQNTYNGRRTTTCEAVGGPMCGATADYLVTIFWPVLLPASLVRSTFGRFAAKREEKHERVVKVRSELGLD